MRHEYARNPHKQESTHCAGERPPSYVTRGRSVLANEPPDAPLEQIRLLEPDHRGRTIHGSRPTCESQKCGGEDKGPASLRGNIVREYFRLVGHVVGQSSQRRDPEQCAGENPKE